MAKKTLSSRIEGLHIDKRFLWIVFLISFSLGTFFAFCFRHPVEIDAVEYDTIAWNLAQGNGFSSQVEAPFAPTMNREPVFPYFLGAIYKIFGHSYMAVYFFQIFIFSLTCILVYFLARDIFGERVAKYSTVFTALSPTLANYPSYLLTETVFTFLLCLSILALTKAVERQRALWFFVSGIILGITALCKVVMLLFFFVVFLGVFLLRRDWKDFFKKGVPHLITFSLAFLIIVSPWIYRNYRLFNYLQIRPQGGTALWVVADKLDDSFDDMKQAAVFNFSEYLGSLLFPGVVDNPRDFILRRTEGLYVRKKQLAQQNFNPIEIEKIIRDEALKKLRVQRHSFLILLAHLPLELIKMTAFSYIPTLNEKHTINKFYRLENGKIILSGIKAFFRLIACPIIVLAIMGMWFERKLWHNWFSLFAIIAYINLIYSLLFGLGRYAVPLIPFYLIFASAGILKLKQKFLIIR